MTNTVPWDEVERRKSLKEEKAIISMQPGYLGVSEDNYVGLSSQDPSIEYMSKMMTSVKQPAGILKGKHLENSFFSGKLLNQQVSY